MQSVIVEVTSEINNLDLNNFEFDWKTRSSVGSVVYSSNVDEKLVGLVEFEHFSEDLYNYMHLIEVIPEYRGTKIAGELLAFVAEDSMKNGFEGFVLWESKTIYYKYYIRKYGAKPIGGRRLYFDENAAKRLIKVYIEEDFTIDDIIKPTNVVREEWVDNYHIPPEEMERHRKIIEAGEERIKKHGYGFIPATDQRAIAGFRYRLAIEDEIGRKISDAEWFGMSIR